MSEPPEPKCEPPFSLPVSCSMDTISECPDGQSKLVVTTKSMTSVDSSCCLSDEQGLAEKQPVRSASGKSILSSCVDADNPSTILSGSIIDDNSRYSIAEMNNKSNTDDIDLLANRLRAEAIVGGNIGSFYEYIRPNADTSFVFSFTPLSGTQHPSIQSLENSLVGYLEKVQVEKSPPPLSKKSIKLRKKRGIDTRSLTFGDTSSQDQSHLDLDTYQPAMRKKSATEPAPLVDSNSHSDIKTTADRRRFDFLVSRLQQKLSERSQGSCGGSTKQCSASEASRRSSRAESVRFHDDVPATSMSSSPGNDIRVGSGPVSSNERGARSGNHAPGDARFEAPTDAQQQFGPGMNQFLPHLFQMPVTQTTSHLSPRPLFPMLPQIPQQLLMWSAQNRLALGWPDYFPAALPAHQPQMNSWPPAPGLPPRFPLDFGAHGYTHQPGLAVPHPRPPHDGPLFPVPPRNLPISPISNGNTPFVPRNASVQQQIEENIEFLKATVPSFAQVSRQRQKQRWRKQKMGSDGKGKRDKWQQYQHTGQRWDKSGKDAQSHQPRLYHQPQTQYSEQAPKMPVYGHQTVFNTLPYPGMLWPGLV